MGFLNFFRGKNSRGKMRASLEAKPWNPPVQEQKRQTSVSAAISSLNAKSRPAFRILPENGIRWAVTLEKLTKEQRSLALPEKTRMAKMLSEAGLEVSNRAFVFTTHQNRVRVWLNPKEVKRLP